MANPVGKTLDLRSVFGLTATIVTSASATDGESVVIEVVAEPSCRMTIHKHPDQDETYQVLDGRLEVFHAGTWHSVRDGEIVIIARGEVHSFRNPGERAVRFLNTHRPALRFEEHLEMLDRLVKDGKITGTRDLRSLIYMSMSAMAFHPDVSVKPPQGLVKTLALVGWGLRYRLP